MQQSYKQQRIQTKDKKTNDLKENPGHSNMPTPSKKYVVISELCNQKKMVSNPFATGPQEYKSTIQVCLYHTTTPQKSCKSKHVLQYIHKRWPIPNKHPFHRKRYGNSLERNITNFLSRSRWMACLTATPLLTATL